MIYLVLAALLCSIGGVCIKMIPWTPLAINGARCAIAACVTGAHLLATHHRLRFNLTVVCGAFSLALTTILYVFSTKLAGAACAILLMYSSPVWVLLHTRFVRHRAITKRAAICCAAVFGGMALFVADGFAAGTLLGIFLGILSGITYAGVFVFGTDSDGDAPSAYFMGQLIGAAAGLPFLCGETQFTAAAIGGALLLGVFQLGLSYIFMAKGVQKTPAVAASLITSLEPILSPVWVAIFYGEIPSALALCGAAVVLTAIAVYQLAPSAQKRT